MTATNCTRCKGAGFGSWVVQHGICWGCGGKGTRAAQIARRDKAAADAQYAREVEVVSVLVGPITGAENPLKERHAAQIAFFEAFVGPDRGDWGMSPDTTRLAPGWYAISVHLHVASFLAELAS